MFPSSMSDFPLRVKEKRSFPATVPARSFAANDAGAKDFCFNNSPKPVNGRSKVVLFNELKRGYETAIAWTWPGMCCTVSGTGVI